MDNPPETIQCSCCKKRFFTDGFKVNRLGRRNKTCLECNARSKALRENRDPEKMAKAKAAKAIKDKASYVTLKNDQVLMAARQLYQVLTNYTREFPDDPTPPTTKEEVEKKRDQHRLRVAVANYIQDFPEDTFAPRLGNWTWAGMRNRQWSFQLQREFTEYVRDYPNDPSPPKTRYELGVKKDVQRLHLDLAEYVRGHPDDPNPPKTREQLRLKTDLVRYVNEYPDDSTPPTTRQELDEKRAEIYRQQPDTSCDCFFPKCRHSDTSDPRR
jgi:hypothetical protein